MDDTPPRAESVAPRLHQRYVQAYAGQSVEALQEAGPNANDPGKAQRPQNESSPRPPDGDTHITISPIRVQSRFAVAHHSAPRKMAEGAVTELQVIMHLCGQEEATNTCNIQVAYGKIPLQAR